MCYAPIKIKNNSLTYRDGIDKMFFTVPCGKCRECQQKKRDDWFVRCYYEWLHYNEIGGQTIFITLTYNDWSKPFVSFADTDLQVLDEYVGNLYSLATNQCESRFVPRTVHTIEYFERTFGQPFPISHYEFINDFGECVDRFNKKDIQDFFKSVRQYFHVHKLYSYDEQSEVPIKYFAVCEYGGEKHRQHIHVLFFLPKKWNVMHFKAICEYCWADKVMARYHPDFIKQRLRHLKQESPSGDVEYIYDTPGTKWRDWKIIYDYSLKRWQVLHMKGFCMYSKDNPPVIVGGSGIEYVIKYLYKADKFLSEERFLKLKTWLEFFPSYTTLGENVKLIRALTAMNDIFPFFLTSQKLGNSLYDQLNSKSPEELINFISNPKPLSMTDNARFFAVPQYILNRLMYNGVDVPLSDNTVRMLTPVGYKTVCKMFDVKIESLARSYAEQVNVAMDFMTQDDNLDFFNKTGHWLKDVVKLVTNYRGLAHYSLVWQNVAPKVENNDKLLWSPAKFFSESRNMYFLQNAPSFEFGKSLNKFSYIALQRLSANCFNYYPAFKNYDAVLDAIAFIRECVGVRDARHEFDDEKQVSRYRECLKMFKYD